jgi:hypothetical protein
MKKEKKKSMKLTNNELEILQDLVQDKLVEMDYAPEGGEVYQKPEVYMNIMKKLDEMYK